MDTQVTDPSRNTDSRQFESQNRFSPLANIGVFDTDEQSENSEMIQVSNNRKRQRLSTGSQAGGTFCNTLFPKTSVESFQKLSVDEKLSVMFGGLSDIGYKVDQCLSIHDKIQGIEDQMDEHTDRLTLLEYKSIDLEARSRRNNLLFNGIQEMIDENCLTSISNFMADKLDIKTCPQIARVHRLGRYKRGHIRPIIVNFLDFRDAEKAISVAYLLKDTKFSINRDFPKEIADARHALWPKYKQLRNQHPDSKISLVYPAKIIKDGRVYADMFPKWNLILSGSRLPVEKPVYTMSQTFHARDHSENKPNNERSRSRSPPDTHSQSPARFPRRKSLSPRTARYRSKPVSRSRSTDRRRPYASNNDHSINSSFNRPWDQGTRPDNSRSNTQ